MNCFLPHLLKYLAAKLIAAANRNSVPQNDVWLDMLSQFGMLVGENVHEKACMVIDRLHELQADDWLLIREWFIQVGKGVVGEHERE